MGGELVGYEALLALDAKIEKVGLTPEELKKFPLVSMVGGAEVGQEEESCSICLEAFEKKKKARRLPCTHTFHPLCIGKVEILARNYRNFPISFTTRIDRSADF